MWISKSKIIELIHIRHELFKAVYLVDNENYRFLGSSEHIGNLGIIINHSLSDIRHEQDDVRCLYGYLCLFSHALKYNIV